MKSSSFVLAALLALAAPLSHADTVEFPLDPNPTGGLTGVYDGSILWPAPAPLEISTQTLEYTWVVLDPVGIGGAPIVIVAEVPEPATYALLGAGLLVAGAAARRRSR